jgi:hypothetical protein
MSKYAECQSCGTIHYIISKEEAKSLIDEGYLAAEFSDRNLEHCSNCGLKKGFSKVTDDYVDKYSNGDHIQPILLDNENLKTITEQSKS